MLLVSIQGDKFELEAKLLNHIEERRKITEKKLLYEGDKRNSMTPIPISMEFHVSQLSDMVFLSAVLFFSKNDSR